MRRWGIPTIIQFFEIWTQQYTSNEATRIRDEGGQRSNPLFLKILPVTGLD